MNSFAKLLKEARKRAGITQKELANEVGIDHSYISKIERGIYSPPARDKVLAIADTLEITEKASRAYFLLAAGCATVDDLEESHNDNRLGKPDETSLPFSAGAFHFPQVDRLEEEVVIDQIRRLLRKPELSREQRTRCIELIRSFLAWLEFQMGDAQEQNE